MKRAAVVASMLLVLLLAPAARASFDPLSGGMTKLVLDKAFAGFLARDQIQISAVAPARKQATRLVLPVSGGLIDPTTGKGEIEHEGALVLRNARKRVPLRGLVVKTTHSPLVAKVGGSQLKIASSSRFSSKRQGFGTEFAAKQLKLTSKVATRLNKKLRPPHEFAASQLIGSLVSSPHPSTTAIVPTGKATLVFDPAFLTKLDQLFVSVNPIFPGEHSGGTFTFPIVAGGALAPDGSQGTLRTGGEIEFLKLGYGQIFWHELWFDLGAAATLTEVDLEPTPAFPGKLGQVAVVAQGAVPIASAPQARTIGLSGAPLTLEPATAAAFNQAFAEGREAFAAGELVATLSFTAQAE